MLLTDKVRKRMSDCMFGEGLKIKEFHERMESDNVNYETLRQFYNGATVPNGYTLNAIDKFLNKKGY